MDSTTQYAVYKRNFSKVSTKSKFGNEKSNKRFAGNTDQSNIEYEVKDNKINRDRSLSCENAGSSNS